LLIFFCGRVLRKCSEEFGGLARFARGREDRSVVLFEKLDPIGDVARVSELSPDPQMGAEECRREFGYQLLGGAGLRTKAVLEIAVEAFLGRRLRTIRCWNQATTRRA